MANPTVTLLESSFVHSKIKRPERRVTWGLIGRGTVRTCELGRPRSVCGGLRPASRDGGARLRPHPLIWCREHAEQVGPRLTRSVDRRHLTPGLIAADGHRTSLSRYGLGGEASLQMVECPALGPMGVRPGVLRSRTRRQAGRIRRGGHSLAGQEGGRRVLSAYLLRGWTSRLAAVSPDLLSQLGDLVF
jgi:hypothetical protein